MDNEKFGNFICNLRKAKAVTQADLAALLHGTDKTISKWECGTGFPDIKLIEPLAESLNVSVMEIMQCARNDQEIVSKAQDNMVLSEVIRCYIKEFAAWKQSKITMAIVVVAVILLSLNGTKYYYAFPIEVRGFTLWGYQGILAFIIWQNFIKGNKTPYKAKKCNLMFILFFAVSGIIMFITNFFIINMMGNFIDGKAFVGIELHKIGSFTVNISSLAVVLTIFIAFLCIFLSRKYSAYLAMAAMPHIGCVYAQLEFQKIVRSLDLTDSEISWFHDIVYGMWEFYIVGIVLMVFLLLRYRFSKS